LFKESFVLLKIMMRRSGYDSIASIERIISCIVNAPLE